eukprot:13624082-Alexandrium_andersonii.AAC.1
MWSSWQKSPLDGAEVPEPTGIPTPLTAQCQQLGSQAPKTSPAKRARPQTTSLRQLRVAAMRATAPAEGPPVSKMKAGRTQPEATGDARPTRQMDPAATWTVE